MKKQKRSGKKAAQKLTPTQIQKKFEEKILPPKVERLTEAQIKRRFDRTILPTFATVYEPDGIPNLPMRATWYNDYLKSLWERGYINKKEQGAYLKPI